MSPAYGGDVVQLGAYTALPGHRRAYFDAFWEEMRALGARPHWSKEMDHTGAEIRALYPMTERFIALRDELDPDRIFANPVSSTVCWARPRHARAARCGRAYRRVGRASAEDVRASYRSDVAPG
jgi:hypothetical protein